MKTTSLLVEMIIIGFFASIWMFILAIKIIDFDLTTFGNIAIKYSSWESILLIFGMAVCYQMGWLVNAVSYGLSYPFLKKMLQNKIFEKAKLEYENVRANVYQNASVELRQDLGIDRTVIRLTRSNSFNFIIIAILVFTFGGTFEYFSVVIFLFAIAFGVQWVFRYKRYHERMLIIHKVMEQSEKHSDNKTDFFCPFKSSLHKGVQENEMKHESNIS